MKKTTYFPLFFNLKDRQVLVIGGGAVAGRRIGVLLDFEAQVTAVAPDFDEKVLALAETEKSAEGVDQLSDMTASDHGTQEASASADKTAVARLTLVRAAADEELIRSLISEKTFMLLTAVNDTAVNDLAERIAREKGLLFNRSDRPENCDFYFPAVARKEEMVIGISSAGSSHGRVRDLAAKIRESLAGWTL
ncbi:MAG: NAD(P)-dependent oxidoreductase [Lachnospiraceae bacterium]|nr:NAD(P)-dependent oxidoreductase [Lachnospiraceae bacterium]